MVKNYFEVLGFDIENFDELLRDNWQERLGQRYRGLIQIVHPDKIPISDFPKHLNQRELSDYCNLLTVEINEAYETLSNRNKMMQYLIQVMQACKKRERFEKTKISALMRSLKGKLNK